MTTTQSIQTKVKAPTKTEVFGAIAEGTGLSRKQVESVFDQLVTLIDRNLREQGTFAVPGLCKIRVIRKPATPERTGINPFTRQETVFKAKPARNMIKLQPLKALKDLV